MAYSHTVQCDARGCPETKKGKASISENACIVPDGWQVVDVTGGPDGIFQLHYCPNHLLRKAER